MSESCQKGQASSYKTNKSWGYEVKHGVIANNTVCI